MKAKIELTAEALRKAIEDGKPTSMTQLAHFLGYKGSVSSGLTKKFRALFPDIEALLKKAAKATESVKGSEDGKPGTEEPKAKHAVKAASGKGKAKVAKPAAKAGKWPRHAQNPFREGSSSYGVCFDIMAAPAHKDGLPRDRLVDLLAKATGKDVQHAAFDVQVVCSARKNDEGLNAFEGPRNRSCKLGFFVERTNGHVRLVLPGAAAKEKL